MPATPTFGRYAELTLDQMNDAQKEAYHFLMNGPRGRLPGPYKVWIHNPKLVHAADPLGQHFTPGHYSLTEREREIAVLVAEGMSNRDIARQLAIAKRTVDAHLGHIFAKLGISSRVRLATWLDPDRDPG